MVFEDINAFKDIGNTSLIILWSFKNSIGIGSVCVFLSALFMS